MATERQARIGLLSRATHGRSILEQHIAALSSLLGVNVDASMFTDLDQYNLLMNCARNGYKGAKESLGAAFTRIYRADECESVFRKASCFAEKSDENAFLLTKESEFCGALRLSVRALLPNCAALLTLDKDTVTLVSQDQKQGFMLDFNPDDPDHCYELAVWGDTWPNAAKW